MFSCLRSSLSTLKLWFEFLRFQISILSHLISNINWSFDYNNRSLVSSVYSFIYIRAHNTWRDANRNNEFVKSFCVFYVKLTRYVMYKVIIITQQILLNYALYLFDESLEWTKTQMYPTFPWLNSSLRIGIYFQNMSHNWCKTM